MVMSSTNFPVILQDGKSKMKKSDDGYKHTMKPKSGHEFPEDFGFGGSGKVRVKAHFRNGGRVNGSALVKAPDTVENVETGMAGKEFRSGFKKGGKVHSDAKMDKKVVASAVHKHEKARHPGSPLTRLRHGGVPAPSRKPLIGK